MQISIHSQKEIKTFSRKFEKMLLVVHLSFLHAKQLLMKLLFESLQTYANLLLGLTLYPYSMCQPMPTGLYTRWDLDSETSRFTTRQNKTRSFENMAMSYLQRTRPECEIESFFTTGRQKKTDCFSVDGFHSHSNTVFEKPWVAFTTSLPVKSCMPLSLKKTFNVVAKRKSSMH